MKLTYTGNVDDGQWLPGVPASDHDEDDAALAEQKIASGLYEDADAPPANAKVSRVSRPQADAPAPASDAQEAS